MSPQITGDAGQNFSYPLGSLTESAQHIRTMASNALSAHESSWQTVQAYIDSYPAFLQPSLNKLFEPYQQRLRSTYQTYLNFADWLDSARNQMQKTDGTIQESFGAYLSSQKG